MMPEFSYVKLRRFREELYVLVQMGVPNNYVELDKTPDEVLEKMKNLNLELAIALGLLH